jgi:subtilisin family serine protease
MSVVMSGTSMAAPHVTGTIALMLQKNSALATADIRDRLRDYARRSYVGASLLGQGWHKRFGHGRLDVKTAVLRS